MDNMDRKIIDHDAVRHFVRNVLGCECPDEVFSRIQTIDDISAIHGMPMDVLLNIGGRLLLAVTSLGDLKRIADNLENIFHEARGIRDSHGFNRFRFVVIAKNVKNARNHLIPKFENMISTDKKQHLHIIDKIHIHQKMSS